ncbi:MAG: hypothetical protein ACREL2_08420, partial [Gemmatimonadales bacterium]
PVVSMSVIRCPPEPANRRTARPHSVESAGSAEATMRASASSEVASYASMSRRSDTSDAPTTIAIAPASSVIDPATIRPDRFT